MGKEFIYKFDESGEHLSINNLGFPHMTAACLRPISLVWWKLLKVDPALAARFRQVVEAAVLDPSSPLFAETPDYSGRIEKDICMIFPGRKEANNGTADQ